MLVLSRKKTQRIVLSIPPDYHGGEIVLDVVDLRGDKVRLGIQADGMIGILREELLSEELRAEAQDGARPAGVAA